MMNVQELIDWLNQVEDKTKPVGYKVLNKETHNKDFLTLDSTIGVQEYADVVELHYDIDDIIKKALEK